MNAPNLAKLMLNKIRLGVRLRGTAGRTIDLSIAMVVLGWIGILMFGCSVMRNLFTATRLTKLQACLQLAVFACLMGHQFGWTQESQNKGAKDRGVDYWIQQLSSEHYLRRESAQEKLILAGSEAVGPLENVLASADLETTELAIRALGEISMAQKPNDDSGAWAALDRISTKRAGSKATRAKIALEEVNSYRSESAIEKIQESGISIGYQEFVIQAMIVDSSTIVLHIDSKWNGNIETLDWLRWVRKVRHARIEGPAVNHDVLERVAKMPDLNTIILANGNLDMDSIKTLEGMTMINSLEFRYTPLDDAMADAIVELPLRSSLSLIGTNLAKAKVDSMREKLPGLKIEYKQGGYLGVAGSDFGNLCQITRVLYDSAAEKAGIKVGDVILKIGDTEIKQFSDLQAKISQHYEGDTLTIEYSREGKKAETTVILGKQVE